MANRRRSNGLHMKSAVAAVIVAAALIGTLPLPAASQTHRAAPWHNRISSSPPLSENVAAKDVRFYSEGIQCYGRIFTPKSLPAESKAPAVVLAPGWGETAGSIER